MDFLHSFAVFLTLLVCVRPEEPTPAPMKAKAKLSRGRTNIFSGETAQLTCSVPDDLSSPWKYKWFQDDVQVSSSKVLNFDEAESQKSGRYTCLGQRHAWPNPIVTQKSDPISVHVDGGWILLQAPHEPLILDEALTLTCRIRGDPLITEVVFYKDRLEMKRQKTKDLIFPSVKLEDNGRYSCRATWIEDSEYHTAMSLPVSVEVLDKVDPPFLEFSTGETTATVDSGKEVVFRCVTQINLKEPGVRLNYYLLKDNKWVVPPSSKDTFTIPSVGEEDTGFYSCKVSIRALNLERISNEAELRVRDTS